jgi:nucleoid DNA-binding protein
MENGIGRKEFVDLYAEKYGTTKIFAANACDTVLELLNECFDKMDDGERISFYGFGTFRKKSYGPRKIGDLVNGGSMELPGHTKIVFERSRTCE